MCQHGRILQSLNAKCPGIYDSKLTTRLAALHSSIQQPLPLAMIPDLKSSRHCVISITKRRQSSFAIQYIPDGSIAMFEYMHQIIMVSDQTHDTHVTCLDEDDGENGSLVEL